MRYLTILSILLVLASSVFAPPAAAETRYVVDELVITLRLGKSTDHKILKNLKTGTPFEVLEDDDKTYIKVRTPDGLEGYVLRQYVSPEIPKKQVIEKLEGLNTSLQKKISSNSIAGYEPDPRIKAEPITRGRAQQRPSGKKKSWSKAGRPGGSKSSSSGRRRASARQR